MRLKSFFERPEYWYRPRQVVRRLIAEFVPPKEREFVSLPWGVRLEFVGTDRWIGRALRTLGIDDLALCETIWRLLHKGHIAVDVGANVGLITTLMALRVGPEGMVVAFEPHPQTFEILRRNVSSLPKKEAATVFLSEAAVSDAAGSVTLFEPEPWLRNTGCVQIARDCGEKIRPYNKGPVAPTVRLDDVCANYSCINLIKIDVEGHEEAVFGGAEEILKRRAARNIIYEIAEMNKQTLERLNEFRRLGYTAWIIDRTFRGPYLRDPAREPRLVRGHPTNILVTLENEAVSRVMAVTGWLCLRRSPERGPHRRSS